MAKDTLHAFLAYLEDAFLIRTTSLFTASERQRMVNPRKAYPIDPGLIPIYERTNRANLGHALETTIFIELLRRGCEVHYIRTPQGHEIDLHVIDSNGEVQLIQVCADASDTDTLNREVRALSETPTWMPQAKPLLITLDPLPPGTDLPDHITTTTAIEWLLEG